MATKTLKKNHSSLMQKLLANSPTKHTSVMSESVFFNEKDVVPIDYPIFNIAFSGSLDGGMSNGLTVFAGVSGVYKTLAALICAKAYMNKYDDAICILLDSEGGVTPSYLKANGIDPSRVLHVPIEHLEMLKFELVKQLKEIERGDHVIFVIDSIGNTGSLAEIQNALDERSVAEMQRAKTIKSVFRMITPSLVAKDIPCICIAHTYEEMGCVDGDTLIKTKSGLIRIKDIKIGDLVFTKNGSSVVDHVFYPEELQSEGKKFLELTFDDGSIVKCTDNHKFLMKNEEWVAAGNMRIGEEFY